MPIVNVAAAMAITRKGFSASNDAVRQLADTGVIAPVGSGNRNRWFVAREPIAIIRSVVDQAIPTELVARESVFA